ncbi:hypothetical protein ABC733_10010 [Mangrovibacter sp. SLW1]
MDAESSRPQADCPEVNAVRSTGCPRKTGLLRGGPLNTFTGCEATLTTPLQVNGTFTEPASAQSERNAATPDNTSNPALAALAESRKTGEPQKGRQGYSAWTAE